MINTLVLAHRGASKIAPENTAIAFKKAFQIGADGIEFDVQMTKDKKLVVIHDERVDRTTNGIGYIKDLTLKEIKQLDAGSYFSPEFIGEKILTLEEALEMTSSFKLINIEIKNVIVKYNNIEKELVSIIKKMKMENKIVCSSFNHYSIARIKELSHDIKTGLLYVSKLYQPWFYAKRMGVDAIHPHYFSVSPDIIHSCHKNNIKVYVWPVDDKKIIKQLISNKIDIIITNYPEKVLTILRNTGNMAEIR